MRKRNTPIRMITVRPAQPRERTVLSLVRRFGLMASARRASECVPAGESSLEGLADLDQRVRAVGEW